MQEIIHPVKSQKQVNKRNRPTFWKVREDIPKGLYYSMVLMSVFLPLFAWSVITFGNFANPLFFPSPLNVLSKAYETLVQGQLAADILASTSRIFWGFLFSAVLSVPIGLLIGTFKSMEGLLEPVLGFFRYMPAAAFIPLIILWVGVEEPSRILIIFLGTFFYNVMMVSDAVKFISTDLMKVSYTLGATGRDVFFNVIFPASLPSIIDTLRINIATAWNFVIVAELIAANSGLGYRISIAQRVLKTDEVFLGIFVIGFIGLLIDSLFKLAFRLTVPWAVDRI